MHLSFGALFLSSGVALAINVAGTSQLQTWWHDNGVQNSMTGVAADQVRQSSKYSIQVQAEGDDQYYDSFVYETIPRSGLGPTSDPNNLNTANDGADGITIESVIGTTMAWSSFLYTTTVTVKVHRVDGRPVNPAAVTVRPTTLGYQTQESDGDLTISVPYSATGTRFSVEFADDLYSYHNNNTGPYSNYVQTNSSSGDYYVPEFTSGMPVVGTEPLNSLLVFASPFETADMVPTKTPTTYVATGGQIDVGYLNTATNTILYFNPGTHYCGGQNQLFLSNDVSWVYFSPGAYVKCSIYWGEIGAGSNKSTEFKATGHGVLSGEQYVFQADSTSGYNTRPSGQSDDTTVVRMWRGTSTSGLQQSFILNGPTVNAPPFQSMDFAGDLDSISTIVSDYKMVGAWFGETDGLENYPGSRVSDVFYHSNDDTLKMYYSNTTVERITVWKGTTAPVIQFGWSSRNINDITVDTVETIHARWNRNDSHPSLIGANQLFSVYPQGDDLTNTGDASNLAQNIVFNNLRVEGIGGNLMRICVLETFQNITISNVDIEQRSVLTSSIPVSEMSYFTDPSLNTGMGVSNFNILNYYVEGQQVTTAKGNYGQDQLGGLNIAPEYFHAGGVTVS